MKQGSLSEYFQGVAVKRLTEVEASILKSNQHEFNGVKALRLILGEPEQRVQYQAKMMYLSDWLSEPIVEDSTLTWYDARRRARMERGVEREEYRLYFQDTSVSANFAAGDLLVIASCQDTSLLVIVAKDGSTISQQVEWLFGVETNYSAYDIRSENDFDKRELGFASRAVLEGIGIDIGWYDTANLDEMISKFGKSFPTTLQFSAYSRSKCHDADPLADPDGALLSWVEKEEQLFRSFERHIVSKRLKDGFVDSYGEPDVDSFVSYSLSVQNRRKSRVGLSLENHLQHVFETKRISYSRTARTENNSRPDFLFPSQQSYHDPRYSPDRLAMLAVKSTCKDRWRQVLAEADRIPAKHLFTLEAPISVKQTQEMKARSLSLVIPRDLHALYANTQRADLLSLSQFLEIVTGRSG